MKVYIIDGNSYIHRAYHALKPLSTRDGFPTHAIYGFTKMLLKILEEKPECIAVVFDVAKKSFRNDIFPEYKANRPPMDDSLVVQIPFIKKIVEALNIPIIEKEDVEADDVIATLVNKFKENEERIREGCEEVGRSLVLLSERRAALITAAVTGQLDMKELAA